MDTRDVKHFQPTLLANDQQQDLEHTQEVWDARRLTQARLLLGMTKQDVAEDVGVSPAAVGQWEAGVKPKVDHIAKLTEVLGQPAAFFRVGRPCVRLDASLAHFRSLRSTRNWQRDKAIAFVEQLWELTYALERRVELPQVDIPEWSAESRSHTDPALAARAVREAWEIGPGPFAHLIRELEHRGVVVSHGSFAGDDTGKINAFSTSHLPRPLMVTTPGKAEDVYRHRFTAAHELGHLVLHRDVQPGAVAQEKEANQFAAELLLPAEEIASELPARLHLGSLHVIARRWGVSLEAIIFRARELGIATDVSARRAYQRCQTLRASGALQPEPVSLYEGESPVLLRQAFELAGQYHGLTLEDLADELVWDESRIRLLMGVGEDRPRLTLVT